MREEIDRLDRQVAEIAARQHGVVAVQQLREVGIGKHGITRRVNRGQLHRIHRGVYAVGHRGFSLHGRFMAAVLACGEGAVLSHTSAVVLWSLLKPIDGPSTSPRPAPPVAPAVPASTSTAPRPSPSLPPPTRGKQEGEGEGS